MAMAILCLGRSLRLDGYGFIGELALDGIGRPAGSSPNVVLGVARLRIGLAERGFGDARIQSRQHWSHRSARDGLDIAERVCGRGFVARANCAGGGGVVGNEHLQPLAQ
jgi:hypothetical protein